MASTFETVSDAVIDAINTEFATEGFTAIRDNLHESIGFDGRAAIGVAPTEETLLASNALVKETWLEVRFYDVWRKEIDPLTQVDPTRITGFAQRFTDRLRATQKAQVGTGRMWYFMVTRVTYPNDPTGNKTRFHATVKAYSNNSNLLETTG